MATKKRPPGALRRRRARLAAGLPDLEHLLRGSLVERYKKCGKPGCHCVRGKGHGPAHYLSVTLAPGKTRSYYLSARNKELVEQHLANYRALRTRVEEIMALNRELLEQDALSDED
jgi:hypothetical protein